MPYGIVAAGALQAFSFAVHDIAVDFRRDVFVTAAAGVFRDLVIEPGDLDGVRVIAAGEVKRVPESVVSFHCILADEVVRGMAIVTGRYRVVARLLPGVILRLHDVAIGARRGVIRHI